MGKCLVYGFALPSDAIALRAVDDGERRAPGGSPRHNERY